MDLIESLWKQDEDMGLTLEDFMPKNTEAVYEEECNETVEKIKEFEAIDSSKTEKVSFACQTRSLAKSHPMILAVSVII